MHSPTRTARPTALRERIADLSKFVGNTPLFPIARAYRKPGVEIWAKLEWNQMGGSVKARPAFNILKSIVESGVSLEGKRILDASSGNTGIAYATFAAALGLPLTICIPENASAERKRILKALGVDVVFTSRFEGTDGAQERAQEILAENPDRYLYPDQYGAAANWGAHYATTAPEIWAQTEGRVTHFVAGLGTTGTFTGTGRRLRELNPAVRLVALQPDAAMHGLEGWKHLETARVPAIYDPTVADEVRAVDTLEAWEWVKRLAREEGLLVSPSAGANLAGAVSVAEELDAGVIVTVFADSADKYGEVNSHIFGDGA